MLEDAALLAEVGAPVCVVLPDGLEVQGAIAWQLGQSAGIAFHTRIPMSVLDQYSSGKQE